MTKEVKDCNEEGCIISARARGKCPMHHNRKQRGEPAWKYCFVCKEKIKTGNRKYCTKCKPKAIKLAGLIRIKDLSEDQFEEELKRLRR